MTSNTAFSSILVSGKVGAIHIRGIAHTSPILIIDNSAVEYRSIRKCDTSGPVMIEIPTEVLADSFVEYR